MSCAATGDSGSSSRFSFFVTSLQAMRLLSGTRTASAGTCGSVRQTVCAAPTRSARLSPRRSLPGSGAKVWRGFLSTSTVNARDGIWTRALDTTAWGGWSPGRRFEVMRD